MPKFFLNWLKTCGDIDVSTAKAKKHQVFTLIFIGPSPAETKPHLCYSPAYYLVTNSKNMIENDC